GVNGGVASAGIENTTRITRDKIGFANSDGILDESKPHLTNEKLKVGTVEITNSGIDAGNQEISNVKSAINPATNGGQPDFVTRLGRAGTNPSKQNSAATVKDLYDLSQSPLTFAGDTGNDVTRKLGDTLKVQGGNKDTDLTENNIGVVADNTNGSLTVKLAKTLNDLDAVNTQNLTATNSITVGSGDTKAELLNSGLTFSKSNT
ncbi:hypothetical protein, partial [Moraxella catarrhalis]|uniref:hypothetical protein n=1 Tax=Moraxella catarrhalis TaxID=480 RepID=UPI000B0820BF